MVLASPRCMINPRFHDIKRLPNNGTVIMPLSISALHGYQSPARICEFLAFFVKKVQQVTNDVVFLYTDGLYLNAFEPGLELHRRILNRVVQHKAGLVKLLGSEPFVPRAFHYLTWNECLIRSDHFLDKLRTLEKHANADPTFRACIQHDMGAREMTDATVRFILEEVVMSHSLRNAEIELPKLLSPTNEWTLITYPGPCMQSEVYVHRRDLLHRSHASTYSAATYDITQSCLMDFTACPAHDAEPMRAAS